MDYIQLKESSVKKFGIRTADGVDTGEYIEIDTEDLEFPERAEKCTKKHLQNITELNNQKIIINKRQDHKDKGELYSDNEKALIKAIQEFLSLLSRTHRLLEFSSPGYLPPSAL